MRKEPVLFRIHKPIMGIGRSRYQNGVLETKKRTEISLLRRLPDNHAEELPDGLLAEKVPEAVEEVPELALDDEFADLPWMEIQQRVKGLGLAKIGMTKKDALMILRAHRAAPEGLAGPVEKTPVQMA